MDLLQRFQEFLPSKQLLFEGERSLIAVSGGLDSMVLADLFRQSKLPFGIAHCNFQLRGLESDHEEKFVREWAERWDIPFFVKHFETQKYAGQQGLSIQMAARALRYTWFEQVRETENFDRIATGHHLNDSVETMLLNLIRGTGLTGLRGIPVQNKRIIRPLLFATRDEILAYANQQNLAWREDSSNASDDYTRNAIRLNIIPQIQKLNPFFISGATKTMEHLEAADTNLNFLLRKLLGTADRNGVYQANKAELAKMPALSDALFDLFQPFGFSADQAQQMVACWNQSGVDWESDSGYRLLMDREVLILTNELKTDSQIHIAADDVMVRLPDGSSVFLTQATPDVSVPENWDTVVINQARLQFPLHLRHWQPGDIFQPIGMEGRHQKLQDFFTNQKLSRLEKEQVWILENRDKKIIWVLGMRLDEQFKPGKDQNNLLKMTWVKAL